MHFRNFRSTHLYGAVYMNVLLKQRVEQVKELENAFFSVGEIILRKIVTALEAKQTTEDNA